MSLILKHKHMKTNVLIVAAAVISLVLAGTSAVITYRVDEHFDMVSDLREENTNVKAAYNALAEKHGVTSWENQQLKEKSL